MQSDGRFAYEVASVGEGGGGGEGFGEGGGEGGGAGEATAVGTEARLVTKIADASAACTMLRAIRAAALLHLHREASEEAKVSSPSPYTLPLALVLPLAPRPRPAHRAPPPPRPHPKQAGHLELACAAAWAKMHAAALKEVQAWEARVAAQVQLAAELRALSPDEVRSPAISPTGRAPASILTPVHRDAPAQVLGVDDLVATLGVDRRDAVEVVCAVRNVEIARRFLRVHCAPHGHRLLQARPSCRGGRLSRDALRPAL